MSLIVVNRSESGINQKNSDPIVIDSAMFNGENYLHISQKNSKPIFTDSTSLKVALYWTGVSLIIISASTLSRFSYWYCITALGTFPLLFPLYLNIKILALNIHYLLPVLQKMQIIALWTLFGVVQLGIGYRALHKEALPRALFTLFAASIGSCSFILFIGHKIINQYLQDKKITIIDLDEEECIDLQKQINYLKSWIEKFDGFINERPHLKAVVEEHIHKYGEYVARFSFKTTIQVKNDEDWLSKVALLSIKILALQHEIRERKYFIRIHSEVFKCFQECLFESKK
ncbi:hypothetical protein [Rhabdochlamydiaceae symbiont of Dictyostelium giganteum]|uniref:hypothetical protein n=1 Tax=Rhabdochlamydiaceae symbiont of Dictyostelium giganteum TaxID=3342349 RepID=UPI003851245E